MNSEQWQRVEELYHAALGHPAGQRAAFLKDACADEDLSREVESLLASERPDGTVLDSPALGTPVFAGRGRGPLPDEPRVFPAG